MSSFVTKMAMDLRRAVELVNITRMLGLFNDIVEVLMADLDPNDSSVIINNTFIFFNDLYFFLKFSLSILRIFNIFS